MSAFSLGKHGGGYWFITGQKWVIILFFLSDKWFYSPLTIIVDYMCFFSLNNYTQPQSLLGFAFLLSRMISGSLPL